MVKTADQVCHVCKCKAKVYDNKKWWCAIDFYSLHGMCRNQKRKDESATNND